MKTRRKLIGAIALVLAIGVFGSAFIPTTVNAELDEDGVCPKGSIPVPAPTPFPTFVCKKV